MNDSDGIGGGNHTNNIGNRHDNGGDLSPTNNNDHAESMMMYGR